MWRGCTGWRTPRCAKNLAARVWHLAPACQARAPRFATGLTCLCGAGVGGVGVSERGHQRGGAAVAAAGTGSACHSNLGAGRLNVGLRPSLVTVSGADARAGGGRFVPTAEGARRRVQAGSFVNIIGFPSITTLAASRRAKIRQGLAQLFDGCRHVVELKRAQRVLRVLRGFRDRSRAGRHSGRGGRGGRERRCGGGGWSGGRGGRRRVDCSSRQTHQQTLTRKKSPAKRLATRGRGRG